MLSEIAKTYHAEKKGNCAQSVAYAYAKAKKMPESEVETLLASMKTCGGGRAPNGTCGALYSALQLSKEENREAIETHFKNNAQGKTRCREIRPENIIPCNRCVEVAADALEKFNG